MGILPPTVNHRWDNCNTWNQAQIIAYQQIRDYEEQEERIEFYKYIATALGAKVRGV